MKKFFFGLFALAAFVSVFGGKVLANSLMNEQAWFHVTDTNFEHPMAAPNCEGPPVNTCSQLYEREDENSDWTAVSGPGTLVYGTPVIP